MEFFGNALRNRDASVCESPPNKSLERTREG
jgi:hypothetical protein